MIDSTFTEFTPPNPIDLEETTLAPYAMRTRSSRGRKHPEETHLYRTPYQRDRDRIVHCTAFRRLMHKTQVLVTQTNDHHRTRLTHTLEVAAISRTLARHLGLNEDLTEAIALAHDLGHPPFGHAGEEALNECMEGHGGFEHNQHGLRILDKLEYRYADFPGLNLSWEVLQAQALHSKRRDAEEILPYTQHGQPTLEAQIVDEADSLAYNVHDIDDALSVGLITFDDLKDVEAWRLGVETVRSRHGELEPLQFQPAVLRALIDWLVTDLFRSTKLRLAQEEIRSLEDVQNAKTSLVTASPELLRITKALQQFLYFRVYRHHRVLRMANKGRLILKRLFQAFCDQPDLLPERYSQRARETSVVRTVSDYIAGMTDRYAQEEYLKLFQPFTPV
ncbi:MAG: deoxyguanosinetriphosphate triphosphohydrolase [Gemmataceae bacterium]